jgi:hypothetical protein
MAARRRDGLAAGGVERHRVPRSDVERVIASSWVTGLSTEIPEIAGGRSGGVHVFVVPDRRPGPSLEPAPATIIGGQEVPVLAVLVLGVAEGQDQRRPVRLDHPGGGDVAAAAAGRVGDVTGRDQRLAGRVPHADGRQQRPGGQQGGERAAELRCHGASSDPDRNYGRTIHRRSVGKARGDITDQRVTVGHEQGDERPNSAELVAGG